MTTALLSPTSELSAPTVAQSIRTSSARIRPDSRWVVYVVAGFVGVILIAAFSVSFEGQMTVAAWAGLRDAARLAVPAAIDSSIVVFTVAAVVLRARGESTGFPWAVVGAFTVVSMAFNVLHVLIPALARGIESQDVVGSTVSGLMPLLILLSTHMSTRLLVAPPVGTPIELRARQTATDLGEKKIFESKLARRKGTPERERALILLAAVLSTGRSVSEIARIESVDRSVIYAAKKEIEGNR
ncbi:DUF2637 domain-containing protein [Lacisediminihabitans sp. FW035]